MIEELLDLNQKAFGLRSIGRGQGIYGADERLHLSLDALTQLIKENAGKPGRKLVIWVSPGGPLLSGLAVDLELTPKQHQGIYDSVLYFSEGLRRARMTLYDVDPLGLADAGSFQTYAYEQFLKGVKSPEQAQNGNLALQVLASRVAAARRAGAVAAAGDAAAAAAAARATAAVAPRSAASVAAAAAAPAAAEAAVRI